MSKKMVISKGSESKMSTEREKDILRIIYEKRQITVKELSRILYTSESSIRRDLEHLENQHLLKRFHGGARVEANGVSLLKVPYIMRELTFAKEKERIGRKAASLLHEQDLVYLDSSSTATYILPYLDSFRDLIIITNGLETLNRAMDYGFRVICTGGTLQRSARAFYGEEAFHTISNYYANYCFISCAAFDDHGNVTDVSVEENEIRRAMMRQSNHKILLCSSEKQGIRKFHHCCNIRDLEAVVTPKPLSHSFPTEAHAKTILAE